MRDRLENQVRTASGLVDSPRSSLIWFAMPALALSAVLPLLLWQTTVDGARSEAWTITLAIMVWSGLRLAGLISKGDSRVLEYVWWLFTYIFMGLAPTYQILSGNSPGTAPNIPISLDVPTALIVLLGVIGFETGFFSARFKKVSLKTRVTAPGAINARRAALVAGVGAMAALYLAAQTGLGALFSSRSEAAMIRGELFSQSSTTVIVTSVATFGTLVGIHALVWNRRRAKFLGLQAHYGLLLIVAFVVLLAYKNPISSARYTFGVIAFSLAVLLGAFLTRKRTRLALTGVLIALLALFPISDAFRRETVSFSREGFFQEYSSADYDAFSQISNALFFVQESGTTLGYQFLGVILFWVPRAWWPEKPLDTGVLLAQFRGYRFENLSAPLWAEFLINGGIFFVFVGFILIGYMVRLIDNNLSGSFNLSGGGRWAIFGAILPFYSLLVLRGSLLQATSGLVCIILLVLFVTSGRGASESSEMASARSRRPHM